jgi:hypothetical protein
VEARDGRVQPFAWLRMCVRIIASGILIVGKWDDLDIWRFWEGVWGLRAS